VTNSSLVGRRSARYSTQERQGRDSGPTARAIDSPGLTRDDASYRSFATFSDPDGNRWLPQEITSRLPGRVDATDTRFASPNDLASALRRAEAAHGEHEKRTGQHDANWADWYTTYMAAEQAGEALPT
jgi:hypothetical protein